MWRDRLTALFRVLLHQQHGRPPYEWEDTCRGCTKPPDFLDKCEECPFNLKDAFRDLESEYEFQVDFPLWNFCQHIMNLNSRITKFQDECQFLTELEREALLILQSAISSYEHWAILHPPKKS